MGARWKEFDLESNVWTIPASRMKAGREHRVPLTDSMKLILEEIALLRAKEDTTGEGVMALTMAMRRLKQGHFTVHGFRSAFRDWVSEETEYPREVAEAALAHVFGDETERAYRRGDALKKRLNLMQAWGEFMLTTGKDSA